MARKTTTAPTIAVAAAAVLALSACVPGDVAENNPTEQPESATILIPTGLTSLDPALSSDAYSSVVQSFLYDKLIGQDPQTGETVSNLASSWEISSTRAHFEIIEGITCSDGTPFTAATVVRNLERLKDPKTAAPLTSSFLGSYNYKVSLGSNKSSVDIEFAKPFAFAERKLAEGPAMVCDSGLDNPATLEQKSAGTGPYELTGAKTGDTYDLKLRDNYTWGVKGGKTSNSMPMTVSFRLLADQDAMANLVTSGDADIAILYGNANERAKKAGDVSAVEYSAAQTAMFFNHREGLATSDPAVRKALGQVVSREDYNSVAGHKTSSAASSITASSAKCSAVGKIDDLLPSGGTSTAATTLTEAGWKKNASGVWEKNGTPLTVRLLNLDTPAAGVEYLRSQWSAFGVDVQPDSRGGSEAVQAAFSGTEWDVALSGYGAATPPINLISGPKPPQGANFSAITNGDYDSALTQAIASGQDCDKWRETDAALIKQVNILPLMTEKYEYVSPSFDLGAGPSTFYLVPTDLKKKG